MTLLNASGWQLAGGIVTAAALIAAAAWGLWRKRLSEEEIERQRREFLVQTGRLVDGNSLDVFEISGADGRTRTMLLYNYRIGGVDYECSQDLTDIPGILDSGPLRPGFPCTVRYQPGNPPNSIAVAENWSGLRAGLPIFRLAKNREAHGMSHLRPGRG